MHIVPHIYLDICTHREGTSLRRYFANVFYEVYMWNSLFLYLSLSLCWRIVFGCIRFSSDTVLYYFKFLVYAIGRDYYPVIRLSRLSFLFCPHESNTIYELVLILTAIT